MMPLSLFRIRNFWVANLTTLSAYAGLIGGLFFVGLFLQQVAGYSPLEAGLATTPISVLMFFLSPRFGRVASGTGPRLPMCAGPIVGGIGLLLLLRVGADPSYVTDVLPGLLVFGVGLSATVAPLTATVLDSVDEHHVGIASGVNNGVSRVAGLLAIAVLGAVISAHFGAKLDEELGAAPVAGPAAAAVAEAKEKPLGGAGDGRARGGRGRAGHRGGGRRLDLVVPPRDRDRRGADDRSAASSPASGSRTRGAGSRRCRPGAQPRRASAATPPTAIAATAPPEPPAGQRPSSSAHRVRAACS